MSRVFFDTEFFEDGRTIDLISIGLVREDGEELYLESSDADLSRAAADPWIAENVLAHLTGQQVSRHEMAEKVVAFCGPNPEMWAYYADYDWVVLCQLFGRMIDLPSGWPMYCRDLKQEADRLGLPLPPMEGTEHHALADARWVAKAHCALAQANASAQR